MFYRNYNSYVSIFLDLTNLKCALGAPNVYSVYDIIQFSLHRRIYSYLTPVNFLYRIYLQLLQNVSISLLKWDILVSVGKRRES